MSKKSKVVVLLLFLSQISFWAGAEEFLQNIAPTEAQIPLLTSYDLEEAETFYRMGIASYEEGDYQKALNAFNVVAQIDPHYKQLQYYAQQTEDMVTSQRQKSVKERYITHIYTQGMYNMQYAHYQKAIKNFKNVLKLAPRHEGALFGLAEARIAAKRNREEKEKAKEKLRNEIVNRELGAVYTQGEVLLENNWPRKALRKFEAIAEVNPDYRKVDRTVRDIQFSLFTKKRKEEGLPYLLGADDVLDINVRNHPELSGKVTVERGGEIILPLIKEVIYVEGLSKENLEGKIKKIMRNYIKEPEIQIVITGYNSKKWYILGESGRRGEFAMGKKRLTIMEALYQAGLPREGSAAMNRVKLIRPHHSKPYYKTIDVGKILYKGIMRDNIYIEPGDIIYVPQTLIAKFNSTLRTLLSPAATIQEGAESITGVSGAARAAAPVGALVGPTE